MNIDLKMNSLEGRGVTFEQLRAFVFVAELGGFAKAGEILGRTQSTLSLSLKRLEEGIGCRLVERKQGHVVGLTVQGKQLLPAARDILFRTSRAINTVKKFQLEGVISLGVPDDVNVKNLNRVISRCRSENPALRVEITAASSATLSVMADKQLLDVVIVKRLAEQGTLSDIERVIHTEPLFWVGADALNFNHLNEIPLVTFPEGCAIRACAIAALEQAGRPYYFSYVSGAFDNIKNAVACGLGIGLLPRSALSDDLCVLAHREHAPDAPSIQLVLSLTRTGRLYERFSHYLGQELLN